MRLSALLTLALCASASAFDELKVPEQFGTITRALAVASPGDVIVLAPGDYRENVVIRKAVTLRGAGSSATLWSPRNRFRTTIAIEASAGKVRLEGLGFRGEPEKNDGEQVLWSACPELEIVDASFLDLSKGLKFDGGRVRLERLRFERCRGDALHSSAELEDPTRPGRLELHDVRSTGQILGYGARSTLGAKILVDELSRLKICVEGEAEWVTDLQGKVWPHTVVWKPVEEAKDVEGVDEFWNSADSGEAAGIEPWTNTDAGVAADEALEQTSETSPPIPEKPEMPREQRLAAYTRLARELNASIGGGAELAVEIEALGSFLSGLYALGDTYGWYPEGGDELFQSEIARFAERHGRAAMTQAIGVWPANPEGRAIAELYNRGYGFDYEMLFVREDLTELAAALAVLREAPDDDSADAPVIDAFAALFKRFQLGQPAIEVARELIGGELERLDIAVAWRLVRAASTHESSHVRNFAWTLRPQTRRNLVLHWRQL